jgi:hypothetical protein
VDNMAIVIAASARVVLWWTLYKLCTRTRYATVTRRASAMSRRRGSES